MIFPRKFLAVLFIVIFIPLFIINILVFGLKTTILNPLYLQDKFSTSGVYEKVIEAALPLLVDSLSKGENKSEQINTDILFKAASNSLDAQWLESQFDLIFEEFDKYLKNTSDTLKIKIDLKEVKKEFANNFSASATQGIENLPECSQQELEKMNQGNRQLQCLPPGFSKEDLSKASKEMFSQNSQGNILSQLPDEYDLGQLITQGYNPILVQAKIFFNYLNFGLAILTGFNALLLILIALLIYHPLPSILRWLSTALVIPSTILLLLAGLGYFSSNFIGSLLSSSLPTGLRETSQNVILALINPWQIKIALIASLAVLLAIIGYIIAHFLNKHLSVKKETQ